MADSTEETRLRDELLSVTAHDLRSPLGAISIFCELLQMGEPPLPEAQARHVQMITEAAAKAQRILEEASELSRIYRGTVTLNPAPTDLVAVAAGSVEHMRRAASIRGVDLEAELPDEELRVVADAERLRQIVLRMVEEAVMACGRGGTAIVRAGYSADGSAIQLEAANWGGGQRPRRESRSSLKGRLAAQKPDESRYSLDVARRVAMLVGGELELGSEEEPFRAVLRFPKMWE